MADVETTNREYISLTDLAQFEEEIIEGYRGDVDANAMRPPLAHDTYLFGVTYAEEDPTKRFIKKLSKEGKPFYMVFVRVESKNNANPEHDGASWNELIMTLPNRRGTTGMQALLQGLEVDTLALSSHALQMRALDDAIAGGAAFVGGETDWEGSIYDKDATRTDKDGKVVVDASGEAAKGMELFSVRGMRNFPKDAEGNPISVISQTDEKYKMKNGDPLSQEVRARNFMRRWVPVSRIASAGVEQVEETAPVPAAAAKAAAPVAAAAPVQTAAPVAAAAPARTGAPVARPPVRRVVPQG